MNGLKYIRTRCNLSLSELADMIGVSRQALSSWENGKKDIPEQRSDQLAEFFGIGKEYFGEISEKEKQDGRTQWVAIGIAVSVVVIAIVAGVVVYIIRKKKKSE